MIKNLLLKSVFVIALTMPVQAFSQSSDVKNRLSRIENEIQTLNQAIFKYGGNVPDDFKQKAQSQGTINHISSSQTGAMEERLSGIEQQLRELTGRLEEIGFQNRQLEAKLESYIADGNLRFQDIERRQAQVVLDQAAAPKGLNSVEVSNPKPNQIKAVENKPKTVLTEAQAQEDVMVSYEQAFSLLRQGQYEEAEKAFKSFLSQHSDHDLASNAQYWLAETYYVRGDYAQATKAFAKGYDAYPKSTKTADNLLKLALSLSKIDKKDEACITLDQLENQVPDAPGPIKHRADQERDKLGC